MAEHVIFPSMAGITLELDEHFVTLRQEGIGGEQPESVFIPRMLIAHTLLEILAELDPIERELFASMRADRVTIDFRKSSES